MTTSRVLHDGQQTGSVPSSGDLARAAAGGDESAWEALVERHTGLLWTIARGFRLDTSDSADVVQTVWLQLAKNLHRLREPDAVSGWLASTARHECLRVIRTGARERPTEETHLDRPDAQPAPDDLVARRDECARLRAALARLPQRDQRLLGLLMASPAPSYVEVAEALGMPIGSIGPTRARALGRLRRQLAAVGLEPRTPTA